MTPRTPATNGEAPVASDGARTGRPAVLVDAPPALVLGADMTALGVVRCLGRSGIRAYLVGPRGDLAAASRFAHTLPDAPPGAPAPEQLPAFLDRLALPRGVLVPCSDPWTEAVAGLADGASCRFSSSVPSPSILGAFIDKATFSDLAARSGVPQPRTIRVEHEDDLRSVPDTDLPGYFLKPRRSDLFNRRFRRKAFPIADRADAEHRLAQMREAGLAAVLQEYVPGPATSHYFVDGFVDRHGVVAARFARRRLRMYPVDFGNSSIMVSVPLAEASQAVADLERFLADVGYRGIFSAEFKRDERDGVLRIIEINTRAWWYVEFAALCGVDVCGLAYRDALGLPVEPITGYRTGERFVFLGKDVRALRALRQEQALGLGTWLRSVVGARPAILRWDDPAPALARAVSQVRRVAAGGRA
ncbi:MAG: hypothetical protein U0R69_14045 [Gaiellales bacterium]